MPAPSLLRPTQGLTLRLDEIAIPETARPYDAFNTVPIAAAIRSGKTPMPVLTVRARDGGYELVDGRDEFAALRLLLGAETASVCIAEEPRRDWRRASMENDDER